MSLPLFPGAKGCGWISKRRGLDDFIIANNCSHQDKDSLITFPEQKYRGNQKGTFPFAFPCCLLCFGRLRYHVVPGAGSEAEWMWGVVEAAVHRGVFWLSGHCCPRLEMLCQQQRLSSLLHGFISLTTCGEGLSSAVPDSVSKV